ncbi:unnamed protein product, partial [Iphiclides podalirius]
MSWERSGDRRRPLYGCAAFRLTTTSQLGAPAPHSSAVYRVTRSERREQPNQEGAAAAGRPRISRKVSKGGTVRLKNRKRPMHRRRSTNTCILTRDVRKPEVFASPRNARRVGAAPIRLAFHSFDQLYLISLNTLTPTPKRFRVASTNLSIGSHTELCSALTKGLGASPLLDAQSELHSARIVNGYEVDITEVPYQAALRRRVTSGWAHMCGAVIISAKSLLTAAHCTSRQELAPFVSEPGSLQAVVGTTYRLSGGRKYDLSKIFIHELYSSLTLENDISLLVTARRINFSTSVRAVNYARANIDLKVGTDALVSGFGITSYEGSSSLVLMAARVKIVEQDYCARAYVRIADITKGMLCANGSNPPRDACQGDSGGPLVANSTLVGIVSWGEGCADLVYPGVYTRVSVYSQWIDNLIEH